MNQPIKAGDLAEVVWGLQGDKSPNLGLVVKVVSCVGEHSLYGRIWRCDAEYAARAQQGVDVPGGMTDFAQSWLRKIEPPAPPLTTQEREVDHVA